MSTKKVKKAIKWALYTLLIPVGYLLASLILTTITIDRKEENQAFDNIIYLNTNGVHLDIVIPKKSIDAALLSGIKNNESDLYLSFGWGDENFYVNTPTWDDLTFKNTFEALFLKSATLMHITRHRSKRADWNKIKISDLELSNLNSYIFNSFKTTEKGAKIILENQGYSSVDDFYKANGSYSCLKTCNSWVNTGFKKSGLKSCYWTPYDFGLLNKYK